MQGMLYFNTTRVVKKNPTDPFDVTEAEIDDPCSNPSSMKNTLFSVFGVSIISCLGSRCIASLHVNHLDGLYTATIREL